MLPISWRSKSVCRENYRFACPASYERFAKQKGILHKRDGKFGNGEGFGGKLIKERVAYFVL